nr:MAG TPA: hypothetical protein [Caudoviricetes sp.]
MGLPRLCGTPCRIKRCHSRRTGQTTDREHSLYLPYL